MCGMERGNGVADGRLPFPALLTPEFWPLVQVVLEHTIPNTPILISSFFHFSYYPSFSILILHKSACDFIENQNYK